MKRIKCPKCHFPVLRSIGTRVEGDAYYYIDRQRFGSIYFGYYRSILNKENLRNIRGFYCRHCGKPFPKEMEKEILHWIKMKGILLKLTQK